ncbi:MAG: 23S rRNA (adenine(2503)-C(2))-methyltransferase RlmN [candidate division WOR-3 bacterium]
MKTDIKGYTLEELNLLGEKLGWERYRPVQIFQWLYQKDADSFDQMTNLSKQFRAELAERFYISRLEPVRTIKSEDRTTKCTFTLQDGNLIESVLIFDQNRRTICLSTQAGCSLACRFCATGRIGFKRNLKWFEIVEQAQALIRTTNVKPTNIVLMGMGEPLLNLDEVLKAVKVINSNYGLRIGARRITISTAGIPEGILQIAQFPLQVRLAISLNATDDKTRSELMPVNKRYPLKTLLNAAREYVKITRRRLTFEYVLIQGVNNLPLDAQRLTKLLKNIPCKINLIPFNPFPGTKFQPPSEDDVKRFAQTLYPHLPAVTIRKSKGGSIQAGCGQLAALIDNA